MNLMNNKPTKNQKNGRLRNPLNPHRNAVDGARLVRGHLQQYLTEGDLYALDRAYLGTYYMRNTLYWRAKFKHLCLNQSRSQTGPALLSELDAEILLLVTEYMTHERDFNQKGKV
jgi:hypothetical protein